MNADLKETDGDSPSIPSKAMPEEKRTLRQNRAGHKGFEIMAESLNGAGQTMELVLKGHIEWTKESVKEYLFKPIILSLYGVTSTTQLTTKQISDAWEILNKYLIETGRLESYVDWPSCESGRFKSIIETPYDEI